MAADQLRRLEADARRQAQTAQAQAAALSGPAAAQQGSPAAAQTPAQTPAQAPAQTAPAAQTPAQAPAQTAPAAAARLSQVQGRSAPDAVYQDAAAQYASLDAQAQAAAQRNRIAAPDLSGLRALTDQWQSNAVRQADGQIDYAVRQGTADLARARDDAFRQYQAQLRQIDADEARARDNQALYNAAAGNTGGIGAAQLDAVAVAAAQNRQSVRQAQTDLSRDVARQISDLRSQGQFSKADAALEIAQNALAQLKELEIFGIQTGLSVDQFNASLDQWLLNARAGFADKQVSLGQWAEQRDYQRARDDAADRQWQAQFDANRQDTAWDQNFRQQQADTAKQQWQAQFDESVRQFTENLSLNKEQLAESIRQWQTNRDDNLNQAAVDNAFRERTQAFNEWSTSTSLDQNQQKIDLDKWSTSTSLDQNQQKIDLDKWSTSTSLDQNQQKIDLDRWSTSTSLNQNQQKIDLDRQSTAASLNQNQQKINLEKQQAAQSSAYAMLNAGIMPDAGTLSAAGMQQEEARLYLSAMKELNAAKADGSSGTGGKAPQMSLATAKNLAEEEGIWNDEIYQAFLRGGYTPETLQQVYGSYSAFKNYVQGSAAGQGDETNVAAYGPVRNTASISGTNWKNQSVEVSPGRGEPGSPVNVDFNESEGVLTVNGRRFTDMDEARRYINSLALTEEQANRLIQSLTLYGFNLS